MTYSLADMRLGPPLIYIPVCKHPRDFMFSFGPLGYVERYDTAECPVCVRTDTHKPERIRPADGQDDLD